MHTRASYPWYHTISAWWSTVSLLSLWKVFTSTCLLSALSALSISVYSLSLSLCSLSPSRSLLLLLLLSWLMHACALTCMHAFIHSFGSTRLTDWLMTDDWSSLSLTHSLTGQLTGQWLTDSWLMTHDSWLMTHDWSIDYLTDSWLVNEWTGQWMDWSMTDDWSMNGLVHDWLTELTVVVRSSFVRSLVWLLWLCCCCRLLCCWAEHFAPPFQSEY